MVNLLSGSDRRALAAFGILAAGGILAAYLFGAAGLFGSPWMWTVFCLVAGGGLLAAFRRRVTLSRELLVAAALSIGFALFLSQWAVPTVFSGRDQGSYALAALKLAESGGYTWSDPAAESFFGIYGEGQALNFPGFFYVADGRLTSQFPLGSIVWSALWADMFGMEGLVTANVAALTGTLLFLYALLRLFVPLRLAAVSTGIFALSFPIAWFSKYTLSENVALPLFLMLAFASVTAYRGGRRSSVALAWTAGAALFLTRIEGFAIFAIALILLFRSPAGRWGWKKHPFAAWWLPAFGALSLFTLSISVSLPFYKTLAKALAKSFDPGQSAAGGFFGVTEAFHLFPILNLYALLFPILIGLLSIIVILKRGPRAALIPMLLATPLFWYFVDPHISDDHPWMLRRFLFALWPALFCLVPIGLALIEGRLRARFPSARWPRYYGAAFLFYIALAELPLFFLYGTHTEHATLLPETHAFSQPFARDDLVLFAREASGDPFAMLPGGFMAATSIPTAYFFNPDDLARLDRSGFARTYLVVGASERGRYEEALGDRLEIADTYSISTERLRPETETRLPAWELLATEGVIYRVQ